MRLSQLTGAQTYSGAQAILHSLAQLYIRLYNGKDTHLLMETLCEHFVMDLAKQTLTCVVAPDLSLICVKCAEICKVFLFPFP